jgi:hypothetical protein
MVRMAKAAGDAMQRARGRDNRVMMPKHAPRTDHRYGQTVRVSPGPKPFGAATAFALMTTTLLLTAFANFLMLRRYRRQLGSQPG